MHAQILIDKRTRDLGGGFVVGRLLPFRKRRMVGPFIFFDHMGPLDLAPGFAQSMDIKPHPHVGLSTLTYLLSGAITHRDSLGSEQEIRPGEVNWMTAGRGITHSERLDYARAHGARMHGLQSWVALPAAQEEMPPTFSHYQGAGDLPQYQEDGVNARLIAGRIEGLQAAVQTYSPLFYLHWDMDAGARRSLGTDYAERAVYLVQGAIEIDGDALRPGCMAVLEPGESVDIAASQASTVMLLGGDPLGERFIYWNFVSSSKDRLEQACDDWRNQRMALPANDDREFIPLPD